MSVSPMIIYRTTDALKWGDGKGANLTPEEADANMFELAQAVEAVESIQPHNIVAINVTGNKMTILLDGGASFGPFTLPVASLRFRGEWLPSTDYVFGDFFTAADGLYLALQDDTSGTMFSAAASNGHGPLYGLIMPLPKFHDIGFFYPGTPGFGIDVDGSMLAHVAVRDFYLPASLPGSQGVLEVAATSSGGSFTIMKNDTVIGSVDFADGETVATFTLSDTVQFTTGDVLKVIRPDPLDDTAKSLALTFKATLGTDPDATP